MTAWQTAFPPGRAYNNSAMWVGWRGTQAAACQEETATHRPTTLLLSSQSMPSQEQGPPAVMFQLGMRLAVRPALRAPAISSNVTVSGLAGATPTASRLRDSRTSASMLQSLQVFSGRWQGLACLQTEGLAGACEPERLPWSPHRPKGHIAQ